MPGCSSAVKTSVPANVAVNALMMLRGIVLPSGVLALAGLHDVRDEGLDLDHVADLGALGELDARFGHGASIPA